MNNQSPHNARREAVRKAQERGPGPGIIRDVEMGEPAGAGISRPERQPCGYGVPRTQCHVGCGYHCRRAADEDLIR